MKPAMTYDIVSGRLGDRVGKEGGARRGSEARAGARGAENEKHAAADI